MNLLGVIGTQWGISVSNLLETVYRGNAVGYTMTREAVQKDLRGHLLVNKCFNSQIITDVAKDNPEFPYCLINLKN